MKQFSQSQLLSPGAALNEVNILRGVISESGVENLKNSSYFGVLDNAMKGYTEYERIGYIFDLDTTTQDDIDDVISTLKHWFSGCLVTIEGKNITINGRERYLGSIKVKWDQIYE